MWARSWWICSSQRSQKCLISVPLARDGSPTGRLPLPSPTLKQVQDVGLKDELAITPLKSSVPVLVAPVLPGEEREGPGKGLFPEPILGLRGEGFPVGPDLGLPGPLAPPLLGRPESPGLLGLAGPIALGREPPRPVNPRLESLGRGIILANRLHEETRGAVHCLPVL